MVIQRKMCGGDTAGTVLGLGISLGAWRGRPWPP